MDGANSQGFAEIAWPAAELFNGVGTAAHGHDFQAVGGSDGSHQHRGGVTLTETGYIKTKVNPVGKVNISGSRLGIHGFNPGGAATLVGMAGTIFRADISFCLDDHSAGEHTINTAEQEAADELPGNVRGWEG